MGRPLAFQLDLVRVRHIGDCLTGTMEIRARLTLDSQGEVAFIEEASGGYKFEASVRQRQIMLAYQSNTSVSQHCGTTAMSLDSDGRVFRGIWTGLSDRAELMSGETLWVNLRATYPFMLTVPTSRLVDHLLRTIPNRWRVTTGHPNSFWNIGGLQGLEAVQPVES